MVKATQDSEKASEQNSAQASASPDIHKYREVAQEIDSGEYFKEAEKWFTKIYLVPYTHHPYTLALLILTVILATIIYGISRDNYEVKKIPFAIYASDPTDEFPRISSLRDRKEDIMISLARYLVVYYAKLREEYDPQISDKAKYQEYLQRVQEMSSRQVYSDFLSTIDPNSNPNSFILLYRDNISRKIFADKVEFMPYLIKPDSAIIYFTAKEINNNKAFSSKKMAVEVVFDIHADSKTHHIDISILSYRPVSIFQQGKSGKKSP